MDGLLTDDIDLGSGRGRSASRVDPVGNVDWSDCRIMSLRRMIVPLRLDDDPLSPDLIL